MSSGKQRNQTYNFFHFSNVLKCQCMPWIYSLLIDIVIQRPLFTRFGRSYVSIRYMHTRSDRFNALTVGYLTRILLIVILEKKKLQTDIVLHTAVRMEKLCITEKEFCQCAKVFCKFEK
ncbi:hypothetical protein Dimus_003745 [Dionaea muscipula]